MQVDAAAAPVWDQQPLSERRSSDRRNRYQAEHIIGSGTFGRVYKGHDLQDNKAVALKEIRIDADEVGMPSTALREIALLRELDHPYIVKLLDVIHSPRELTLVFEYVAKDLKDYMTTYKQTLQREPFLTKFILWQLLQGLDYIHRRRMLHRDLKPQNILINPKQTMIKLADFGLARVFGIPVRNYTHEVVTLWYRAPEILLGAKVYSTPVDMWSVGCIFAELAAAGEPLFPGECEITQLFKIFQALGTPTESEWRGVSTLPDYLPTFPKFHAKDLGEVAKGALSGAGLELLAEMLRYAPEERISARDALRHPYFEELHAARPGTWLPMPDL